VLPTVDDNEAAQLVRQMAAAMSALDYLQVLLLKASADVVAALLARHVKRLLTNDLVTFKYAANRIVPLLKK
jgi:hypothetical protein